ncbi:hypothetical protein AQJ23_40720 [Streptomyces antibioticus]|nr:hypothetical protein [Streptomyces antibioticus]KUN17766.1 hypothetical protein AQJ23_40720 [Streptomyces antibioticus]
MTTGVAVICDTEDCLAVYLAVQTGDDGEQRSADEVSQTARKLAEDSGWVISFGSARRTGSFLACHRAPGASQRLRQRGNVPMCAGR